MSKGTRLFVPGGIYHVYCKTHRGEMRFDDPADASAFVDAAARVVARGGSVDLSRTSSRAPTHSASRAAMESLVTRQS